MNFSNFNKKQPRKGSRIKCITLKKINEGLFI